MRKKRNLPPPKGKPLARKAANCVDVGEDSDSAEEQHHNQGKSFPINALSDNENFQPRTVPVVIHNKSLDVLPDSGAKANVMPSCCLPETLIKKLLRPTKSHLSPYKSAPIIPLGKIFITTNWGNRRYLTKWYVVDTDALGSNIPLLSCKTSEALGIITFNSKPPGNLLDDVSAISI